MRFENFVGIIIVLNIHLLVFAFPLSSFINLRLNNFIKNIIISIYDYVTTLIFTYCCIA